jgi:hypothetical protein
MGDRHHPFFNLFMIQLHCRGVNPTPWADDDANGWPIAGPIGH